MLKEKPDMESTFFLNCDCDCDYFTYHFSLPSHIDVLRCAMENTGFKISQYACGVLKYKISP